jgi:type I restriction enzyme S subunit
MIPLLQTHFETALDHPNGIKKLRELILSLAMQGKLVVQDKNDQPARELLKEIQAEKERLVKEGKIRKTDALSPIKDEEKPFVLPEGWEWVRLGDVCNVKSSKRIFESDYCEYEIEELVEQLDKLRAEELPIETAMNAEYEERSMSELMKIIESRLLDIE